jgi:hypothetical protein
VKKDEGGKGELRRIWSQLQIPLAFDLECEFWGTKFQTTAPSFSIKAYDHGLYFCLYFPNYGIESQAVPSNTILFH